MSSNAALPPLGVVIDAVYHHVNQLIAARLAAAGYPDVRPAHTRVFDSLGGGRRVSELAERGGITKQSMAELVEHLERLGYVERVPDPSDRRARIVRLTARGESLATCTAGLLEEVYGEWERLLGSERLADVHRALAVMAEAP